MSKIVIRSEERADRAAVAGLTRAAFGRPDEAMLVAALREGGHVVLSLLAEEAGSPVGYVLFTRLTIETEQPRPLLKGSALAPLAVAPARQGCGIGSALVRDGLSRLTQMEEDLCFVLGDPAYYRRFGFDPSKAAAFSSAYSGPHFMAIALSRGGEEAMRAAVVYPVPFAELA